MIFDPMHRADACCVSVFHHVRPGHIHDWFSSCWSEKFLHSVLSMARPGVEATGEGEIAEVRATGAELEWVSLLWNKRI